MMRKHLCCLNTNGIFPLREARIQEHPYLGVLCMGLVGLECLPGG